MARRASLLILMLVVVAGCDRFPVGTEATTVPTTTVPVIEPATTSTTAPAGPETTTTTPEVFAGIPPYTIISRVPGDSGDTVVVLLEPDEYTEIQIADVIRDVVERFAPVRVAHLIDDEEVRDAVTDDDPTEAEQALLERHYLARLDGVRLVYLGPLAGSPEVVLGS